MNGKPGKETSFSFPSEILQKKQGTGTQQRQVHVCYYRNRTKYCFCSPSTAISSGSFL